MSFFAPRSVATPKTANNAEKQALATKRKPWVEK